MKDLEELRTFELLRMSTRVCVHCDHYKTTNCPYSPSEEEFKKFRWTSLSTCESWVPNPTASRALEVLTWRKLEGKDIEYRE